MRKLLTLIWFILLQLKLYGQDPQFSQFYSNPLYLSPSLAGAVEGSRVSAVFRDQWWEAAAPFKTYSISYDHYFSTFNSGVGLLAYKDVAGSGQLGSLDIGIQYSYNFKIFNVYHLRPGLSFYYVEHGLNDRLLYVDQILDDHGYTGAPGKAYPTARDIDAGASALFYSANIWGGVTVDHLLTPNISLYSSNVEIPIKTSIYGGYVFRRKGRLLKPSDETMTFAFLYQKQQSIQQLNLGVYWYNYPLVLGFWYRGLPGLNSQRGDAIIFLVGIKTRQFNIGYSYDFTISNLLGDVRGTHELTMTTKFLLPKRTKKGSVPCPEF